MCGRTALQAACRANGCFQQAVQSVTGKVDRDTGAACNIIFMSQCMAPYRVDQWPLLQSTKWLGKRKDIVTLTRNTRGYATYMHNRPCRIHNVVSLAVITAFGVGHCQLSDLMLRSKRGKGWQSRQTSSTTCVSTTKKWPTLKTPLHSRHA